MSVRVGRVAPRPPYSDHNESFAGMRMRLATECEPYHADNNSGQHNNLKIENLPPLTLYFLPYHVWYRE